MIIRLAPLTLLAALGLGCAGGGETPPVRPVQGDGNGLQMNAGASYSEPATLIPAGLGCTDPTPSYEEVAVFNVCVHCHSSANSGAARNSAPAAINFDTEAAAAANAAQAVHVVKLGAMPPRATGITLTDEEKEQLYQWAMCAM